MTDEIQVVIEAPKFQAQIIFDKKIPAEVHELHKQSPMTRAKKSLRSREPGGERTRKNAAELDVLMAWTNWATLVAAHGTCIAFLAMMPTSVCRCTWFVLVRLELEIHLGDDIAIDVPALAAKTDLQP